MTSAPSTDWPFLGTSATARLIARHDWSLTSLGPIATWPAHVRTAVAMMLRSDVPLVMLWGEHGVMVYNDAYSVFAGGRHPQLLGSRVREGWPEVADFNDNVMKVGLAGGTLAYQEQELTLHRNGRPEQVWMNLDYSPLPDADGRPAGVMAIVVETTAKVRAERRVSGERERLRHMFQQAPGFIALLSGADHVFELANDAYLQLIGMRDVLGKQVRHALPELKGQGFFELLDRVYTSGEAYAGSGMEVQLQRTPGAPAETRHVDFVYQPVRGDHGAVVGIFVEGADVTDRLRTEQALRVSEAQFRTFAQAVPNHLWAARPDGALDWVNQQVLEYTGVPAAQVLASGWAHVVHPDDLAATLERWQQALASGERYQTEFRLRRADGAWRWHIGRALPIRADDGRITQWIGTNTDIDAQKTAQQALAHLNATLEDQVAQRTAERDRMWRLTADLMLVAGLDGTIVSTNPAWGSVLGWPEEELQGRSFLDLVHPDDLQATLDELGALGRGEATYKFENRYRQRDDGWRLISWTAVPGERHVHAVGRDITADRQSAEALRRSQAALLQAQKMESVGQLTGGVAHDFNNLLQVIGGNLHLLGRLFKDDAKAQKLVASAISGVSRGARLASQLLAFGRRQALEPKVVDVGQLIAGMEEMLRRTLGESVEVRTRIAGERWNGFVDPVQVENAVLNLAINARDAMDGSGRLRLEVDNVTVRPGSDPELAPGDYVQLTVADSGSGMTPEVLAKAFEPFFSTKPEGRGTGLGLSMVYGFVKQSGGHVKIDSAPGRGTAVSLFLPRSEEAPASGDGAPAPKSAGGHETVLVAEDDPEVRGTVVAMLESLGYRVLQAENAAEALDLVRGGAQVDLLFTDVVMPGAMRSGELAQLARRYLPSLAVLFTSGYAEDDIVHDGRLDAGVELLRKPYGQDDLAARVRQVLDQKISAATR